MITKSIHEDGNNMSLLELTTITEEHPVVTSSKRSIPDL